ncbi:MAG: adenine phosphoribosyltransferase [Nanoarchaeota archaeon]|nr:adenine phosphoribosyltransferase [Nanoarchaeota archaeon]
MGEMIKFETKGRTGILTLYNPPYNMLNQEICELIIMVLESVRVKLERYDGIVIVGEGKHFCAGVDVEEHLPETEKGGKVITLIPTFHKLLINMSTFPIPIVALIHGSCMGGGLEFARACHMVIALDKDNLRIGLPEIKLGCFPPFGLALFPRLSYDLDSMIRFLLTGRVLKGKVDDDCNDARMMGLVDDFDKRTSEEVINQLDFNSIYEMHTRIVDRFQYHPRYSLDMATILTALEDEEITNTLSSSALYHAIDVLLGCSSVAGLDEAVQLAEKAYLDMASGPDYTKGLKACLENPKNPEPGFSETGFSGILKMTIRTKRCWPKPGVSFRDITPVLMDPVVSKIALHLLERKLKGLKFDAFVGVEARGFPFGGALTDRQEKPLVLARKPGKLPFPVISADLDTEYSQDGIQIHADQIEKGKRYVIIDDLIAKGGTLSAIKGLIEEAGGIVVSCVVLVKLTDLNGRKNLAGCPVYSCVEFTEDE